MSFVFDHEKLAVYQEALVFCGWVGELLDQVVAKASVKDQLDRASTSVPLNIAEGNAKFSVKDRVRFLEIACGSALECAACLDVMVVRKLIAADAIISEKQRLVRVVQMLMGLHKRFAPQGDVVREEAPDV
jgi:four helix bundle protein